MVSLHGVEPTLSAATDHLKECPVRMVIRMVVTMTVVPKLAEPGSVLFARDEALRLVRPHGGCAG